MKHPKTCSLPASLSCSSSAPLSPTPLSTFDEEEDGAYSRALVERAVVPEAEPDFVELLARSNFSFLQGASHPEELVIRAKVLGYRGLAISDVNGLYGIVRGFQAAEKPSHFDAEQLAIHHVEDGENAKPFHYMSGVELTPNDASPIVLLPMNKTGHISICRLLTAAKRRSPKGHVVLSLQHVLEVRDDVVAIPLPPWDEKQIRLMQDAYQDRLYLPVCRDKTWEALRFYQQALKLERDLGVSLFATNRPLFHEPSRKPLHDVLTCILHKTTLQEASTRLTLNRERYLKTRAEMGETFRDRPDLLLRTLEIAKRLEFRLDSLRYRYPQKHLPAGLTAPEYLRQLAEKGLLWRYPLDKSTPEQRRKAKAQLDKELSLIATLEYEDYFLTLWDICQFAEERKILYQGRGSAANSILCFVLGLTAVDPIELKLLFERFLSAERGEPPDIDIDFEHERREEVIQHIYAKYGANHAAMVCTVIRYRSRMATREVAKAMGISLPQITKLISFMGREGLSRLLEIAEEQCLDVERPPERKPTLDASSRTLIKPGESARSPAVRENYDLAQFGLDGEKFKKLLTLALAMQGFPRHLGIHSGGFVISRDPITDIVPVESATMENRYVVQWNKDDINTLELMKLDFLSLGMLSALRKSLSLLQEHKGHDLNLARIPIDDPETYKMIRKADTVGVFQIESRAQMSMLPRLKPENYYDLVIQVAIVRPGPIQGGMIHPYLKRRAKTEKVTYAHPCLEPILSKTLGVPLFQEQVMQIAVKAAGFSPGEADELRRVVSSAWKRKAVMKGLRERVINGMLARNISQSYAEQIYQTIEGFSSYGFPESHAASFALLTYASCYIKCHHPDIFACSLLNSQPMGFYSPRQLIADAQRHQVPFRDLDVQHSNWDYTLEKAFLPAPRRTNSAGLLLRSVGAPPSADTLAVRVGLRSVYGLREEHGLILQKEREARGPFESLPELIQRTRLPRTTFVRLAAAGALRSFGLNPREALWIIQGLSFDTQSLLFGLTQGLDEDRALTEANHLPQETDWEDMRREYHTKGFALEAHPLSVIRPQLMQEHPRFVTARALEGLKHRTRVRIAGLKSLMQKPPTAKGMCFISMEDETGLMNIVIAPDLYQQCRLTLQQAPLLEVDGVLESVSGVINVRAQRVRPLSLNVGN